MGRSERQNMATSSSVSLNMTATQIIAALARSSACEEGGEGEDGVRGEVREDGVMGEASEDGVRGGSGEGGVRVGKGWGEGRVSVG